MVDQTVPASHQAGARGINLGNVLIQSERNKFMSFDSIPAAVPAFHCAGTQGISFDDLVIESQRSSFIPFRPTPSCSPCFSLGWLLVEDKSNSRVKLGKIKGFASIQAPLCPSALMSPHLAHPHSASNCLNPMYSKILGGGPRMGA
eukprot:142691-Pelagomonas_calceolata.AAC.9